MYVITGATGNTGKPITLALLQAGKKVRIISRSAEKAKELTDKGAELFVGDTSSAERLTQAFAGATAAYAMIPDEWMAPDTTKHQMKHADAIAAALQTNGVKYVVSLSAAGTRSEKEEASFASGLRYMEQKFNAIGGLNTLHLRCADFMENTLGMIGMIKTMGIMGSPVKADQRMDMIATKDIAAYAAKRLMALDFSGHNLGYLFGERAVTFNEVARAYGKAIGKPDLKYVEVAFEDAKKAFMQLGASESFADMVNTSSKAINEGRHLAVEHRDAASTTPTSIEEFAETFAYVYNL